MTVLPSWPDHLLTLDEFAGEWEPLGEFEVITRHRSPNSVRVPDVLVVPTDLVDDNVPRVEGTDVLLAVEIVSPGSQLTDTVTKPAEYASVGIPHYWVIDLEPPISLTAYHLAGEFGYQEAPAVTGSFTTAEPFPLTIDLPALTARRGSTERTVEQ